MTRERTRALDTEQIEYCVAYDGAQIDYGAALLSGRGGWTLQELGIVLGVIPGSSSPLDDEKRQADESAKR